MTLFLSDDVEEELRLLGEWEENWRSAVRRGQSWAPGGMLALSRFAEAAPWMEPEAMIGLARSGVDPDTDAGRAATDAAAVDYVQGWRQGREPGEIPAISRRTRTGRTAWSDKPSPAANGRAADRQAALANESVQAALAATPLEQIMAGDMTAEEMAAAFESQDLSWADVAEVHNGAVAVRQMLATEFGQRWLDRHLPAEVRDISRGRVPVTRPEWMGDDDWERVDDYLNGSGPYPTSPAAASWVGPNPPGLDPALENWLQVHAGGPSGHADPIPADVADAIAAGRFDPDSLSPREWTARAAGPRGVASAVTGALTAPFRAIGAAVPDIPGGREVIAGPTNPTVPVGRVAFMALNAPIQELQGAFRAVVSDVQSHGWASLLNPTDDVRVGSQSDLGVAIGQFATGKEVDTGSGFFVSPESAVGRERLRREQHYLLAGESHVITPGRWAADTFTGLDPGDTGFGAASGVVDFAVAVGADPTNWVGGAGVRTARARPLFREAGSLGDLARVSDEVAEVTALGRARVGDLTPAAPPAGAAALADATVDDLAALAAAAAVPGPTPPPGRPTGWPRPDRSSEEAAGLYPAALQPDLDPDTVSGWLLAGDGRGVVERVAAEGDFYSLWQNTNGKIDASTLLRLADTDDPDEVTGILFDALRLRGDKGFDYRPPRFNRSTWTRRAFADMPVNRLRTDDPAQFLTGLDAMLRNAQAPEETIAVRMRQAAEARTPVGRVGVFEQSLDTIAESLVGRGVAPDAARAVTRHIRDYARQDRLFNTRDGISTAAVPEHQAVMADGEPYAISRSHLAVEMAPDLIQVPNVREIRRLTSWMQRVGPLFIGEEGGWQNLGRVAQVTDALSTQVWKRLTLLRIAWPVRQVLIDEQLRMASTGMPSIWRSPIHLLASIMFDSKTDDALVGMLDQPNGSFRMASEFQSALLRGGLYDPIDLRRASLGVWARTPKEDSRFVEHWGRELGELAADPIASRLAAGESVEALTDALMGGDLAPLRAEMAIRHLPESMADEAGVANYVASVWERLRHKTGENPDLMAAVGDGYLPGAGRPLFFSEPGTWQPTDGFHAALRDHLDSGPDAVKGERRVDTGADAVAAVEGATNRLFHLLGSAPSNILSRAPAWRWYYFESLAERMGMFTEAAQDAIIEQAGRYRVAAGWSFDVGPLHVGSGDDLLRRLTDARSAGITGTHDFADAAMFGRVEAMERTKALLGDLTTKNQLLDSFRVILPFGSAWREAMSAYGRLVKANPLVVYDITKGVQGGIESGFFYRDANGEMVFAYPGSAELMSLIPGAGAAPFPMTGRVQGLTMGFEVLPGVGPVATFPLAHAIPDTPSWDGFRDLVIPYGTEAGVQILVPEWLEKWSLALRNSEADGPLGATFRTLGSFLGGDTPQSVASFNSSVADVMTYLISTGDYDLNTPAGVTELEHDARDRAVHLWFWRGLAQSVVPSAPRPTAMFETGDGDTILVSSMFDRLQALREQDPLTATRRFLDEFGPLAFGLLSPKTDSNAIYVPYDQEGFDWVRNHGDLMDRYPEIGALFAPRGGGPAGIGAYLRRIEDGQVSTVEPDDWLARGQDALASVLYDTARENAEERAVESGYEGALPEVLQDELRQYREFLFATYPGYLRDGRTSRDIQRIITDLDHAVEAEPVLAASDAGAALALYLDARDNALARLRAESDADSLGAASAAGLRRVLYDYGEQMVREHPDFINLWERVFSREVELVEDEGPIATTGAPEVRSRLPG